MAGWFSQNAPQVGRGARADANVPMRSGGSNPFGALARGVGSLGGSIAGVFSGGNSSAQQSPAVATRGAVNDSALGGGASGIYAGTPNPDEMRRQIVLSQGRPTQEQWDAAQNMPRNPNQDTTPGMSSGSLADAQALYDRYASGQSGSGVGAAPDASQTGNMDPNFMRQQVDRVFGQYGRKPTEQEYQQWIGYMSKPDQTGSGEHIQGWNPYWEQRLAEHAQGDAQGNPIGGGMAGGAMGSGSPYSLTGANNLASFSAPGLAAPWTQQFNAPDPNAIAGTPAYQFRMGQGMDAIQKGAASKGTLFTGGTLKDLNSFAQGLASTEYDKQYGRDLGEYQMNRGTFWGNQNNAFDKLSGLAGQGANAASSYSANLGNLYQGGANANAAQTGAENQGWQNTFGSLAELGTAYAKDKLAKDAAKKAAEKAAAAAGGATKASGGTVIIDSNI